MRALLHTLALFPIGSYVTLSDGSVAKVLRTNGKEYTKPIVQRLQNGSGCFVEPDDDDQLVDLTKSELTVVQALPLTEPAILAAGIAD